MARLRGAPLALLLLLAGLALASAHSECCCLSIWLFPNSLPRLMSCILLCCRSEPQAQLLRQGPGDGHLQHLPRRHPRAVRPVVRPGG